MIVTLLTDYGRDDDFVGVCHGVILGICPEASIVDITHGIRRYDVRQGALVLRNTLSYMPVGVHVAVVDPQVGTERRGIAVRCEDGRVLVGPDNGLLSLAWERAGGVAEAIDVTRSPHRLEPLSATFHGRDIFAPVAAQIASGADFRDAGDPLPVEELAVLDLPEPIVSPGSARAHALLVDGYGNVSLDLSHDDLLAMEMTLGARVEVGGPRLSAEATIVQTFADVVPGEMLVYEDAWGAIAVAVNRGDAAKALGVSVDTLRRWDRAGKLRTTRDERNRRRVPEGEVARLSGRPRRHGAGDTLSARNRFPGVVRSVEVDGVMALVEIEAGPFLVTAAVTRDAVEELGLAPGVPATAAVKATSVMVERDGRSR